jgi:hypothetical protein
MRRCDAGVGGYVQGRPGKPAHLLDDVLLWECSGISNVTLAKDGIMEDPRTCKFDVGSLPACAGDRPGEQCVTQAQSSALRKLPAVRSPTSGPLPRGSPSRKSKWK